MKERHDLVQSLLRKADSDILAAEATLNAGALDATAFHAQQAAEKLLKAYLTSVDIDYPFTHNLARLVELCARENTDFDVLRPIVEILIPYAVELRYDGDFWPDKATAEEALSLAHQVKDFVMARLA
ncbi:MAG: HEPN domain-containing protein [Armatimonadota bacterium]